MVPNFWKSPLGNQTASFVSTLWRSCVKWNYSLGCIVCTVIYSIAWMRKTSPIYSIYICNQSAKKYCCLKQAPFTYFPEIDLGIWDWGGFPLLTHFVFPALQHEHNSSFLETVCSPRQQKKWGQHFLFFHRQFYVEWKFSSILVIFKWIKQTNIYNLKLQTILIWMMTSFSPIRRWINAVNTKWFLTSGLRSMANRRHKGILAYLHRHTQNTQN